MYKKFSLEQLLTLKTGFFSNLKRVYEKRRYPALKIFLRDITKQGNTVYFWRRGTPLFRIIKNDETHYTLIDEQEKIELHAGPTAINKMQNIMKTEKTIQRAAKGSKTMSKILWDDFDSGKFGAINNKPYLVYDIETTYATSNLKDVSFYLAYAYIVNKDGIGKYSFIGPDQLEKFVQFMNDFEGYVVGFNNIAFDNPVSVYNIPDGTDAIIDTINQKSIDLFLFLWNLTGRRIGLNRTAQALVGITKTLESGAEGDNLMKMYEETGDQKYYTKFKKYCKNDVEMTVLVLFYLLKHKKVYLDDTEYTFSLEDFMSLSQKKITKKETENRAKAKTKATNRMFG